MKNGVKFGLSSLLVVGSASGIEFRGASSVKAEKVTKPNIMIIMADDLGYSDLGCMGGEIDTKNIDALAKQGVVFTQLYNAARCCPTRASLLTGLYPHKAGLGHLVMDRNLPGYRGHITKNTMTIAEALKEQGYNTYMTGKWHLSNKWKDESDKSAWPTSRGFDKYYGFLVGHTSLWNPKYLVENGKFVTVPKEEKDYFFTDKMTDYTLNYIDEASKDEKPFFMYVAYPNPHYPLHARQETIAKYDGVYDKGWDKLRAERFENLKKNGMIPEDSKLAPRDEMVPAWEKEPWKAWQAKRMQTYAAMVDEMDQGVGRIIEKLKKTGELDNTIIFFTSDNGASPEGHLYNTIERLNKPWTTKMYPKTLPDGRTVNAGDWPDEPMGGPTTYGSYGIKWANVSNTPFRRHKHWAHEGGICSPMIVYAGQNIGDVDLNNAKNSVARQINHNPSHVVDIMPTCLEFAKGKYPTSYKGKAIPKKDGKSLVPAILYNNKVRSENDAIYMEHEGNRAIRVGDWKLVSEYLGSWKGVRKYEKEGRWELYNISEDRTELNDLAKKYPEKVKELSTRWKQWASRSNVVDYKNFDQSSMQKPD